MYLGEGGDSDTSGPPGLLSDSDSDNEWKAFVPKKTYRKRREGIETCPGKGMKGHTGGTNDLSPQGRKEDVPDERKVKHILPKLSDRVVAPLDGDVKRRTIRT